MVEEITNQVQLKRLAASELSSEAIALSARAKELPKEARMNIPIFSGNWAEDGVRQFMEQFRESIKNPIRHKNREALEKLGLQTKGISEDVFDDSISIQETIGLFGEVEQFDEVVARKLVEEHLVTEWLREGAANTKEKLQEILDAKPAFKRIASASINTNIKNDLLLRSLSDQRFVSQAEDLAGEIEGLQNYGMSIGPDMDFAKFTANLKEVVGKCSVLQSEYDMSDSEITAVVKALDLPEAETTLSRKVTELSEKRDALLEEWNAYAATLRSIGQIVPETPRGIKELAEGVRGLKEECLTTLGEGGLAVLAFLKGESDLADNITNEDIRKALRILRPMFRKILSEEDSNA